MEKKITMIKSSLTNLVVEANPNNYSKGRSGQQISKITIHHMAGILSVEECGKIFQREDRKASANYGIGNNGEIACFVGEENRAWTSSSATNDNQAITIEVSNSEIGGDWKISDKALNSLINLCTDICKRYNFKLTYDNTKNSSLTRHNMFSNTTCPGTYLQNKFPYIVEEVNKRLESDNSGNQVVKSNEELAIEVIKGLWGNGIDRKNRLTKAGYNYNEVQSIVNQKLKKTSFKTYTVMSGDTLSGIAKKLGISNWRTLYNNNKDIIGNNPNLIKVGQVLKY